MKAKELTDERGAVYGPPQVHFGRTARLAKVIQECDDEVLRHPMYMICDKLARLIESPDHEDSWQDIAGYARTALMILGKAD